jgi:hypothetical protein
VETNNDERIKINEEGSKEMETNCHVFGVP